MTCTAFSTTDADRRGVVDMPVDYLGTMPNAMISIILVGAWKYFPFVVIAVLARLQTIPDALYEAARIDGAGPIARFFDVTLPQLRDVLVVIILLRAIWDFKEFDLIFLLTGGGPVISTQTLPLLVYKEAFALNQMGMAAAYAVVMMAIMLVFMIVYIRRTREKDVMIRRILFNLMVWGIGAGGGLPAVLDGGHLAQAVSWSCWARPPAFLPLEPTFKHYVTLLQGHQFPRVFPQLRVSCRPTTTVVVDRCRDAGGLQPRALQLSRAREPGLARAVHLPAALGRADPAALPDAGQPGPVEHDLQPGDRLHDLRAALCAVAAALVHGGHPRGSGIGGAGRWRVAAGRVQAT
jgi:hypothetical protein